MDVPFDIPFACVFVAYVMIWVPRLYVARSMAAAGGYDNHHPREQQQRLDPVGKRAAAAHANSFEAFAPFAAAVVVARLAGADSGWTAALCLTFTAARVAYPFLYVHDRPTLRSAVWTIGLLATGGLFLLALVS
jgi:uncharacterized MAPEG superfamily protein